MADELIRAFSIRGASDAARIRRILLITASYFGIGLLSSPHEAKEILP